MAKTTGTIVLSGDDVAKIRKELQFDYEDLQTRTDKGFDRLYAWATEYVRVNILPQVYSNADMGKRLRRHALYDVYAEHQREAVANILTTLGFDIYCDEAMGIHRITIRW